MTSTLTVRSVPEETLKQLKIRAAQEGMSLQQYALAVITREAATPSNADIAARLEETATAQLDSSQVLEAIDEGRSRR